MPSCPVVMGHNSDLMGDRLLDSSGHRDSPGKDSRVGCHALQGISTQGSYPGLPHCGQILYQLSHQGRVEVRGWLKAKGGNPASPPAGCIWDCALQIDK